MSLSLSAVSKYVERLQNKDQAVVDAALKQDGALEISDRLCIKLELEAVSRSRLRLQAAADKPGRSCEAVTICASGETPKQPVRVGDLSIRRSDWSRSR